MGCNFECISGSNFSSPPSPLCIVYCVLLDNVERPSVYAVLGLKVYMPPWGGMFIEMCTLLLEKLQKTGGSTISCHSGDRRGCIQPGRMVRLRRRRLGFLLG